MSLASLEATINTAFDARDGISAAGTSARDIILLQADQLEGHQMKRTIPIVLGVLAIRHGGRRDWRRGEVRQEGHVGPMQGRCERVPSSETAISDAAGSPLPLLTMFQLTPSSVLRRMPVVAPRPALAMLPLPATRTLGCTGSRTISPILCGAGVSSRAATQQ